MAKNAEVIVIGGGGHAKVIIDILQQRGEYSLLGIIDYQNSQTELLGLPVLGDDSILCELRESGVQHAIIAIGNNDSRRRLAEELQNLGFNFINAISSYAYISPYAQLGCGIAIMPGAVIQTDTTIGDHAIVNTHVSIDHDSTIGAYSHIAPGATLTGDVLVGQGAFIGAGATVLPQRKISEWAIVGAGAVVTHDVASHQTVTGIPARQL